jgi:hypothetical protein
MQLARFLPHCSWMSAWADVVGDIILFWPPLRLLCFEYCFTNWSGCSVKPAVQILSNSLGTLRCQWCYSFNSRLVAGQPPPFDSFIYNSSIKLPSCRTLYLRSQINKIHRLVASWCVLHFSSTLFHLHCHVPPAEYATICHWPHGTTPLADCLSRSCFSL